MTRLLRRLRRAPLSYPYANRPVAGELRLDPSLRTAAELVSRRQAHAA